MSMNDIKAMLLHILHRLEQMVIGFQMGLPGDAIFNQRSGEEGDLPGRCFRIAWRQEGNLMPLRDLFFNKMMKNILRPTVIPGRNRDPGGAICAILIFHSSIYLRITGKVPVPSDIFSKMWKYSPTSIIVLLLNSVTTSSQLLNK